MRRFYLPELHIAAGGAYILPERECHHLIHVLRLGTGNKVNVFDGKGTEFLAEIEEIENQSARLRIIKQITPPAFPLPFFLAIALPLTNREKVEFVLEKATELGVNEIRLFESTRTRHHSPIAEFDDAKLIRWQNKTIDAAKQSGRATLPLIRPPERFAQIIDVYSREKDWLKILPWEKCDNPLMSTLLNTIEVDKVTKVSIVIGAEGGFEDDEARAAEAAGFQLCSLGTRILKLETAAVAALALVLARFSQI